MRRKTKRFRLKQRPSEAKRRMTLRVPNDDLRNCPVGTRQAYPTKQPTEEEQS